MTSSGQRTTVAAGFAAVILAVASTGYSYEDPFQAISLGSADVTHQSIAALNEGPHLGVIMLQQNGDIYSLWYENSTWANNFVRVPGAAASAPRA